MSGSNRVIQQDIQALTVELEPLLRPLSGGTLLVTGGSGFLCSYFLDTIAHLNDQAWERPCRVLCMDNLRSGLPDRIAHLASRPDFRLIQQDVAKPFSLDEPVGWIIHGASIASPAFYRRYPLETIAVNVQGTWQMLDLARQSQCRSALFISSSEVYGDPPPSRIPTSEDYWGNVSCVGPRACYDESKRLGETLCLVYHRRDALPVKIVRPFNVYGPGQRLDDRRIIPDLMSAMLARRPLVLYSDGRSTRTFCYISDAIRAMWLLLLSDANGEVFNVGNDQEEIAMRALGERAREVAGPPWLPIEHRVSEDAHYVVDSPQRRCPDLTRLRTRFASWTPRVSLTEGLRRTLDSYQAGTVREAEQPAGIR